MKRFVTILFVLIFALAGNIRSQDYAQNKTSCNSISFKNGDQTCKNAIVCEDFYFDGQDSNDMDGFKTVAVFPFSFPVFQHSETIRIAAIIPFYKLIQVSELHLDLPPPTLSF